MIRIGMEKLGIGGASSMGVTDGPEKLPVEGSKTDSNPS